MSEIEASRQNRVLRLRVRKLDEAIDKQRHITSQVERARQFAQDSAQMILKERNQLRNELAQYKSAMFRMSEAIGWLHAQLIVPGAAEDYVANLRSDNHRCSMCGSPELSPADYQQSDGGEIGVGLRCDDCGYEEDVFVRNYRPFVAPGEPGSHDTMGHYGLEIASLPWVLRREEAKQ